MRNGRHVTGYLFGLALGLISLASAAVGQSPVPEPRPALTPAMNNGNGKIAFVYGRCFNFQGCDDFLSRAGIYVMNPDGSGRTQLTSAQAVCQQPNLNCTTTFDYFPTWSPDGRRIVFVTSTILPGPFGGLDNAISVMNADGSDKQRLAQLVAGVQIFRPSWSPDGTRIAFSATHAGDQYVQIYVMNADGSDQRLIGPGIDPAWSPDGSKIAISLGGIALMNPDGSGRIQITPRPVDSSCGQPDCGAYDAGPAWSPDGSRLAFTRWTDCDGVGDCASVNVWTVNADGSNLTKLTEGYDVGWSPDGTKIVFTNSSDIFVMNPDGSGVTNITNRPDAYEWAISPSWQPVPLAPPPGGNPIDDPQFFVRQHYLDFLSREPEQSGLDAWLHVLGDCPAGDLECRHQARLTTSASFFGSPEFQLKGYFVFRFYKVAFGRLPEYGEITPDMRSVTGQTPAEVYTRKAAFADSFAQRPEFTNSFGVLANADYVAALLNRYQLTNITTPDPADPDGPAKVALTRSDLLGRLDAGVLTRAQVLRAVADSDEVFQAEYNRAFVAMQYYGYLRRTPEVTGYNAWLTYLNAHPQDFREMVRGFVDSVEYRARFVRP